MVRGLYTAASGALVAQNTVDVLANNLANVNTVGFKRSLLQVVDSQRMDIYRIQTDPGAKAGRANGVGNAALVGSLGMGALIFDTPVILDQGPLQTTDNPLDMALHGPGYFVLQTPDGNTRYTRNGGFVRNAQGGLVTENGDAVMGQNGPIQLGLAGEVQVKGDGSVYVNHQLIDKLRMVEFLDPQNSRPEGANRAGAATAVTASRTDVVQYHLERSNAEVVKTMTDLITAERLFDANTKVMQSEDELNGEAIQTVGRTNS